MAVQFAPRVGTDVNRGSDESSGRPVRSRSAAKLRADTGAIRMSPSAGAHGPVGRPRHRLGELRFLQLIHQEVQHAVHQGDVDALPFAGARTLHHRRLNCREAENAAENIGDEHCTRRRPVAVAGIAHQRAIEAALGMNDHRIGGALGLRTGLAVAGNRAVNQSRIDLSQRLISETQTLHHTGSKILDQDVGVFDHAMHELDCIWTISGRARCCACRH